MLALEHATSSIPEQRATCLPMAQAFGPSTGTPSGIDESGAPCVVLHIERRSTTLAQEDLPRRRDQRPYADRGKNIGILEFVRTNFKNTIDQSMSLFSAIFVSTCSATSDVHVKATIAFAVQLVKNILLMGGISWV
jgi:hypothetical protein